MATKWTLLPIHATQPQIWICWTVSEADQSATAQTNEEAIQQPVVSPGYTCAEDCSEAFPGRAFFLEPINGREIFRVVLVPNAGGGMVISCSCQEYAENGRCRHGEVLKALEGAGSWNRHYWQEYAEGEPYTDEELEQMAKMSSGEAGE